MEPVKDLSKKHCVPCEGGVPPLSREDAQPYLAQVPRWEISEDGKRISRTWSCKDFRAACAFVNAVAEIAEREQHHPDIHLENYRRVRIDLSTHAIHGLSENDFILAAKIEDIAEAQGTV